MYAVIKTGGKQYKVAANDVLTVEKLEAEAGAKVSFDQVLLVSNDKGDVTAGTPFVAGAKVLGVVGELDKGKKVRIFKKKRRKQYRRTKGHRSLLTRVRITDIQV